MIRKKFKTTTIEHENVLLSQHMLLFKKKSTHVQFRLHKEANPY